MAIKLNRPVSRGPGCSCLARPMGNEIVLQSLPERYQIQGCRHIVVFIRVVTICRSISIANTAKRYRMVLVSYYSFFRSCNQCLYVMLSVNSRFVYSDLLKSSLLLGNLREDLCLGLGLAQCLGRTRAVMQTLLEFSPVKTLIKTTIRAGIGLYQCAANVSSGINIDRTAFDYEFCGSFRSGQYLCLFVQVDRLNRLRGLEQLEPESWHFQPPLERRILFQQAI